MTGVQGETLSAGTTNATVVTLTDVNKNEMQSFFPKVISGTVKFGVGSIAAGANGFTSSDTVPPIRCLNGNLYVKQAASGDTFVLTANP